MEWYPLDNTFRQLAVIDTFSSGIWTERHRTVGDFKLTVPATKENFDLLPRDSFIQVNDTDEVGIIRTKEIDDGNLSVSGELLTTLFKERPYRTNKNHATQNFTPFTLTAQELLDWLARFVAPGQHDSTQIPSLNWISSAAGVNPAREDIPGMEIDESGAVSGLPIKSFSVPFGDIYTMMEQVAAAENLGFKLYLAELDGEEGFTLKFKSYRGRDLTSSNPIEGQRVVFSVADGTLANSKELYSSANYKNICWAFASSWNETDWGAIDPGYAEQPEYAADPDSPFGFDYRAMFVFVDVPEAYQKPAVDRPSSPTLASIMNQKAADALANNNFTQVVDGEVVPQSPYIYRWNYDLGDIIELEGASGYRQNAQITEYIRTQDGGDGEKAYPTVSITDWLAPPSD